MDPSPQYCYHCGNDGRVIGYKNGYYHEECFTKQLSRCENLVSTFMKTNSISKNIQYMALDVTYLYGKPKPDKQEIQQKKKKRTWKLKELTDFVSALRNSNGGFLLIQIVGIAEGEIYTGAFDEFADKKLYDMIEDGSLFDEAYRKTWLKDDKDPRLNVYQDFLVLYVEKGLFWSTSDFKTKLALDFNLEIPLPSTMRRFVNDKMEKSCGEATAAQRQFVANSTDELQGLQENRKIQLKGVLQKDVSEDPATFGKMIWIDLRLREYISAFTKNKEGGSYFLGIGEVNTESRTGKYMTKKNDVQGFYHQSTVKLKLVLEEMVKQELSYVEGCDSSLADFIKIQFLELSSGRNVMEVSVSPVPGMVFYDKEGPESYRIIKNQKVRVSVSDWLKAMKIQ